MPLCKTLNVLDVRLAADGEARSFDPSHAELKAIERHDFDGLFPKVVDEPWKIKYPLGNFCFELCFASEDDNRLDCTGR